MAGFYKSRLFWIYWLPVLGYCAAIFIQSAYPSPDCLPVFQYSDKIMHFLGYAVLGALVFRALKKTRPHRRMFQVALFGVLLTTLYGMSDEVHQSFVASRMAEMADVAADFVGGTFGVLCFSLGLLLLGGRKPDVRNGRPGNRFNAPPPADGPT